MTAVATELLPRVRDFISSEKKMLIGGEWVSAESGRTFETIDPATARPITSVAHGGAADIDRHTSKRCGARRSMTRVRENLAGVSHGALPGAVQAGIGRIGRSAS